MLADLFAPIEEIDLSTDKLLISEPQLTGRASSTDKALSRLSIVVPIGPDDESWRELLHDLHALPAEAEVLLVATVAEPDHLSGVLQNAKIDCQVHWLKSPVGRASQMNSGAAAASGDYLWFLHADSRFGKEATTVLSAALSTDADALFYFDLEFRQDGPRNTQLNTRGVRFRSEYLGLPFGDQGFCLPRQTFERLGGFNEQAAYGEDHLLVWASRRAGVPLRRLNATVSTSARKYRQQGWLRTTSIHLWRTVRQALPEWWRYVRG